jgi:hypothetical protein
MAQTCQKTDRVSLARPVPYKRLARQHKGSSGGEGKAAPAQHGACSLLVQSGAKNPFSSRGACCCEVEDVWTPARTTVGARNALIRARAKSQQGVERLRGWPQRLLPGRDRLQTGAR